MPTLYISMARRMGKTIAMTNYAPLVEWKNMWSGLSAPTSPHARQIAQMRLKIRADRIRAGRP